MKRFGQPGEIALAVLYLTSPESAFLIGADLIIDGGMETLSQAIKYEYCCRIEEMKARR